jgi:hypothetical protein
MIKFIYWTSREYSTDVIYNFKPENGNSVQSIESEDLPFYARHFDLRQSGLCVYNNSLYMFGYYHDLYYHFGYAYYDGTNWHGKHDNASFSLPGNMSPQTIAVAVIKDTLGLFYVEEYGKLYYRYMTSDGDWSDPKHLSDGIIMESNQSELLYGSLSCVPYPVNDKMYFLLSVTSKDHKSIGFWHFDTHGNLHAKHYKNFNKTIYNQTTVDGSVNGGGYGRPVQGFYSYHGSTYSCDNKLGRYEYYPQNGKFENLETFNSCPNSDSDSFLPSAAEYVPDNNSNVIQKKIVMSYLDYPRNNFHNQKPDIKYYVWNSDKLVLFHETKDTTLKEFEHLVGIIEGPPPYVLNGFELSEVAGMGFDNISYINLGRTYGSSEETQNGFQTKIIMKSNIYGLSNGFINKFNKEYSHTSEFEHSTSVKLLPFSGQLLMKVKMVPHFSKKMYKAQDYDGHTTYDIVSRIGIASTEMQYPTDFLSKTNQGLDLSDIDTYMNRGIDFESYNIIYETSFQHVAGTLTSGQLSLEKEYSHTSSQTLEYSSSVGTPEGFFSIMEKGEYKLSFEISSTTTMGSELDLTLHCPGGDEPGEILKYNGMFYWMKYTKDKDNWWKFEGLESDEPWIMTYEVYSKKISK